MCVCCRYPLLYVPAPVTCLRTPSSYACLCAQAPAPRCYAMRLTTQPHLSALSFSAVPCERDYSEPYSTPWAISPESVLPVGPSVVFSLIQYASVKLKFISFHHSCSVVRLAWSLEIDGVRTAQRRLGRRFAAWLDRNCSWGVTMGVLTTVTP